MAITKDAENVVTIKVIGIGGAGNNVVNRMAAGDTKGVEFIAVNTDKQALAVSGAKQTIQIGEKLTHGQGAGSDPDVGKRAAEESRNAIAEALEGTDMVFLTAGMGGGTGTGAAPVVAEAAKDAGILTVGVVTRPFSWEGRRRALQAQQGVSELMGRVDSLLIIPNDRLKYASPEKVTLANAFEIADDVLIKAVSSISELIKNTGFINLDFADVTAVMKGAGLAHMGVGRAAGKNKAEDAAKMAVSSPLMETSIDGARGVLINITGSKEMGLDDVEAAAMLVQGAAHPEANIIFGASFDDSRDDEIVVTVIATGFDEKKPETVKIEEPRDANLFTDARERAESQKEPAAVPAPEEDGEDPFDTIFKIFNKYFHTKKHPARFLSGCFFHSAGSAAISETEISYAVRRTACPSRFFMYSRLWMRPSRCTRVPTSQSAARRAFCPHTMQGR